MLQVHGAPAAAMSDVLPKMCALKFNPPTLVLLYLDQRTKKHRRRSMPLRGIRRATNIEEYATELLDHPRHAKYFKSIPTHQLHNLLIRIREAPSSPEFQNYTISESQVTEKRADVGRLPTQPTSSSLHNLPPLTDKCLNEGSKKDILNISIDGATEILMDEPCLQPGTDYSYSYDEKSLSFPTVGVTKRGSERDGSETEQDNFSLNLHDQGIVTENSSETTEHGALDLNKVSEEVLANEKKKMNIVFETHHVKPGEDGWVYDKSKDFEPPNMESGWDSDQSVDEF